MVDETWHRTHGSGRLEVPLSAVAVLAMQEGPAEEREELADTVTGWDHRQFAGFAWQQWVVFVNGRPDLVNPAWPLISVWHGDNAIGEQTQRSTKQVADAAITWGLLELTGTERRLDADLFGALLTELRPRSDLTARGQFYTPADVAEAQARLIFEGTASGAGGAKRESIHDPAAGTGGLFRTAANAIREQGRDPAGFEWVAVDIDHLAIACLAVNVVLWGLGYHVLLAVSDCLTDPSLTAAIAQRRETIDLARNVLSLKRMYGLAMRAEALVQQGATAASGAGTPGREPKQE